MSQLYSTLISIVVSWSVGLNIQRVQTLDVRFNREYQYVSIHYIHYLEHPLTLKWLMANIVNLNASVNIHRKESGVNKYLQYNQI